MKLMSEKQKANWEKTRAKGFNRFVIVSVLFQGTFVPVCFVIFEYVTRGKADAEAFVVRVILFSLGGLLSGWFTYERNERLYEKSVGKNE